VCLRCAIDDYQSEVARLCTGWPDYCCNSRTPPLRLTAYAAAVASHGRTVSSLAGGIAWSTTVVDCIYSRGDRSRVVVHLSFEQLALQQTVRRGNMYVYDCLRTYVVEFVGPNGKIICYAGRTDNLKSGHSGTIYNCGEAAEFFCKCTFYGPFRGYLESKYWYGYGSANFTYPYPYPTLGTRTHPYPYPYPGPIPG
jgi:hypothetical protein